MIGMRCYCMLVLRELGKNQPLVIESGKFIIVNIAGFLNSRAYSTAIGASYNFDKRVTNVVLPTEAGPTTNMIVVNSRRND